MSVQNPLPASFISCDRADDIAERLLTEEPVTAREEAELSEHLQACGACRGFESALGSLVAPGPSQEATPERASIRRQPMNAVAPLPARRVAPALLALAATLVALTAAWLLHRSASAPEARRRSEPRRTRPAPTRVVVPPDPPPAHRPAPAPEEQPEKPRPRRRPVAPARPEAVPPPLPDLALSPMEPGTQALSPDVGLLDEARRLRVARDFTGAAAKYRQLADQRGDSVTGLSARVSLGFLLLDHLRQPGNALLEFDRAIRGPGHSALAEEALHGRARALRDLGRRTEERAAIRIFLSRFPASLRAPALRQRLAEITESAP